MPNPSATVRAAADGVSAHMVWQLVSRAGSFLLRAIVVRALGPKLYALTEIRVGLAVSLLILPISGFRKVSLRVPDDRVAAALSFACVLITATCAIIVGLIMIQADPVNTLALSIIISSLIIRACAEPSVIFTSRRERYVNNYRARAASSLISALASAVSVTVVSLHGSPRPGVSAAASAMGHVAYSTAMFFTMGMAMGTEPIPFSSIKSMLKLLVKDDLAMAAATTWHFLLKFILGNGENFVLQLTCLPNEQGAYILAGNFASITARFFNEALEDQCFNVFHRLSIAFRPAEDAGKLKTSQEIREDEKKREESRATCIATLHLALKATLLMSMLFAIVGPPYAYPAIRFLYSTRYSDETKAPVLLSRYFLYLVFIAANGVTEAFFQAAASTLDLRKHSFFSSILSATYMICLYVAGYYKQATGIIAVNCANMTARTIYSLCFYCKLTKQSLWSLRNGFPHLGLLFSLFFARFLSQASEERLFPVNLRPFKDHADLVRRLALHAISGLGVLVIFVLALYIFERNFIREMYRLRRRSTPPE